MARIWKPRYAVMRPVVGPDGKPVMVKRKRRGRIVEEPKREPARDKAGKIIYRESENYRIEYRDADDILTQAGGYPSKKQTEDLAAHLVAEAAREKQQRKIGITDRFKDHRKRPLLDHLADYKAALEADGASKGHIATQIPRIEKVLRGCKFTVWADIQASRVHGYIAELRRGPQGLSIQTANYYLTAVKGFLSWMVKDRRAADNPLAHLQGGNAKTDRRHDRRALDADELRRLLDAARGGPVFRGLAGEDRAMLYMVAALTGLRRSELASLTPQSFDLKAEPPTVTVRAAYSKHRRDDIQPIPVSLAAPVAEYLAARPAGKPVWNIPDKTAVMIRRDLRRAKAGWIRETQDRPERRERLLSDFLATVDAAGRYADFHALRHSYVSALALAGVNPKTAQSLARHSTITLTMDRYTHVFRPDEISALEALPDLSATKPPEPEAEAIETQKEGTHDAPLIGRLSRRLSILPRNRLQRSASNSSAGVKSGNRGATKNPNENGAFRNDSPLSASTSIQREERGRRESNPQPSDRQSDALTN